MKCYISDYFYSVIKRIFAHYESIITNTAHTILETVLKVQRQLRSYKNNNLLIT